MVIGHFDAVKVTNLQITGLITSSTMSWSIIRFCLLHFIRVILTEILVLIGFREMGNSRNQQYVNFSQRERK